MQAGDYGLEMVNEPESVKVSGELRTGDGKLV